tara:strand:- start:3925 stop:4719 length:795 start_codon:yes stop_codon:yes gene_type:complete
LVSDIAPTLALIRRDQPTINHAPAFNALVYVEQSDPPNLGVTFREFDPILEACPPMNPDQCHREGCQSTLRYLNLVDRYPEANEFALVAFQPPSATGVGPIEAAIQSQLFGHADDVCEHKEDEDLTDPLKEMLNGIVNNTLIEGAKLAYLTSYFSYLIEGTSEVATCEGLNAYLLSKCEEISEKRTEFFNQHKPQILFGLKDQEPREMDTLEMDKKRFEKFPSIYRPRAYKRPKTPDSFIVTLRDETYEDHEHHRNFLAKLKLS